MPRFSYNNGEPEKGVKDTELGYVGFLQARKEVCQKYIDMLNYADQHMPKPKKTLADFLDMSNEELTELAGNLTNSCADFCDRPGAYYNVLRPELRELGYCIDLTCTDSGVDYTLHKNYYNEKAEIRESTQNTPARIYTILYLLAKELNRDKDKA